MAIQRKYKHIDGLKELDEMLDALIDPKFRARALRAAARKSLQPVKATLESKLPAGGSAEDSYKHYESSKGKGYKPGDLRKGVRIKIKINTDKNIKVSKSGKINDNQKSELYSNVTFDSHVYKLASILENGRTKRVATTGNGKVFHAWGNPTDQVKRDIGETAPRNFVSSTFAEHETDIAETFKKELTKSIIQQQKKYDKEQKRNGGN